MVNDAGNVQYTAHVFLGQHRVQTPLCPLHFAGPTFHTVCEECHEQSAGKGSKKKQVQAGSTYQRIIMSTYHYVNVSLCQRINICQHCLVFKFSIKLLRINQTILIHLKNVTILLYNHCLRREGVWSYHHLQCWL